MKRLGHFFRGAARGNTPSKIRRVLRITPLALFTAVILFAAFLPLVAITPKASALAGETFEWIDEITIRMSGGGLSAPVDLDANSTGSSFAVSAHGVATLKSGCQMQVHVIIVQGPDFGKGQFYTSAPITEGAGGAPNIPKDKDCMADPNSPNRTTYAFYDPAKYTDGPAAFAPQITINNVENAKLKHTGTPPPAPTGPDPADKQTVKFLLDTQWKSVYQGIDPNKDEVTDQNNLEKMVSRSDMFYLCSLDQYVNANQGNSGTYDIPAAEKDCQAAKPGVVIKSVRAPWNVASGDTGFTDGASTIRYAGEVSGVKAGTYVACDVITKGCSLTSPVIKKGGEVLLVDKWKNPPDPFSKVPDALGETRPRPSACDLSFQSDGIISMLGQIITCPIINGAAYMMGQFDNFLNSQLQNDLSGLTKDGPYHSAWNSFRVMALGLIIIVALVTVIAQALGSELVDAYTLRKLLPALLGAAIFVGLSWDILKIFFELSNAAVSGVRGLVYAPFKTMFTPLELGGGASWSAILIASGGAIALGWAGLLSFVLTALMAVALALLAILLIHTASYALLVVAPFAIACSVLPGTRKVYEFWKGATLSVLLAPAAVAAVISVFRMAALISYHAPGNTTVHQLIAIVMYFGADFVTIWVIGRIGGAAGALTGVVNDRSKGAFDRLKNFRGKRTAENWTKTKQGNRFSNNNVFARGFNSASMGMSMPALSLNPKTMGQNIVQARRTRVEMMTKQGTARIMNTDEFKLIKDDDNALMAATYRSAGDARRGLAARGWNETRINSAINAVHTSVGFGNGQQVAAAQQLSSTGTGYVTYKDAAGNEISGMEDMIETQARASNGNKQVGAALARHTNSTNKAKGRHDMSPGTKNMMNAINEAIDRQQSGVARTRAEAEADLHKQGGVFDKSWESGDPYTLAMDKTGAYTNNIKHWRNEYVKAHKTFQTAANNQDRAAALQRAQQAEAALYEMDQFRTYATGDNVGRLNALYDDKDLTQARQWLDAPVAGAQAQLVPRRGDVRNGENPDSFYEESKPPTYRTMAQSRSRVRMSRPPA